MSLKVEVLNGVKRGMTDDATVNDVIALAAETAGDEFLCYLGTGSEACTTREPSDTEPSEVAAFFGCPDDMRPCSKISFTFSGGSDGDNIGFRVSHSVQGCVDTVMTGGCVQDPVLANSYRAASWSQVYQPSLLIGDVKDTSALTVNSDGTRTLTVYWQGQRGQRRVWDDTERVWSRYPDLDPVGGDYFVFRAYSGNTTFRACTLLPDPCWTQYRGDAGTQAYVVLDDIQLLGTGRGKKPKTTGVEFEIQAFRSIPLQFPTLPDESSIDYKNSDVVASNLESSAEVMLVDPSGSKQMLAKRSIGIDPDDPDKPDIYRSGFRFTFPESGCYEFRLLEVFIQDVGNLEYVWYSQGDTDAIKTLWVNHVQGGATSWSPEVSCL